MIETHVNPMIHRPGFAAVDEPKLSCQPDDDFCEPGCEGVDMQCINGDDNTPLYCEDINNDGFCDITYLSDGSKLIEDQREIERIDSGADGDNNVTRYQSNLRISNAR
jgi:hypothetical protein